MLFDMALCGFAQMREKASTALALPADDSGVNILVYTM